MNNLGNLLNDIVAIFITGSMIFGAGYTIKEAHDFIRKETLSQISQGLSSSEELANALTGEKLPY